jgi:hypothetical protein
MAMLWQLQTRGGFSVQQRDETCSPRLPEVYPAA